MQLTSIQDAIKNSKLPRLDTELLLSDITGLSRTDLYLHLDDMVDFSKYHDRRLKNEPIQYITGKAYFRDLELKVGPGVLIPRPETEMIPDIFDDVSSVLDIGTGSGCLAISFKKKYPEARVVATEISDKALFYAENNIKNYDIELVSGTFVDQNFDLVVSNPPYIPTKLIDNLDSEVKDYEPMLALDGGEDGLKYLESILDYCKNHATRAIIELHEDSFDKATTIANRFDFKDISIVKDLNNKDRFLVIFI